MARGGLVRLVYTTETIVTCAVSTFLDFSSGGCLTTFCSSILLLAWSTAVRPGDYNTDEDLRFCDAWQEQRVLE